MQYVNFFEPQYRRRPQYSYDDVLSYLAQQEYESRLAEEYSRQAIAKQRAELERQRYLEYLREQEELRIQQEYQQRIAEAHRRALERKRRIQHEKELQRARSREARNERQREKSRLFYHPAIGVFQPIFDDTHSDEDPDVSVPDDLYSTPNRHPASAPVSLPNKAEQSNRSELMNVDDFVSNLFTHFLGSEKESERAERESERESEEADVAAEELDETAIQDQLNAIKSKVEYSIDTYERLFLSENSGDAQTAKDYTSRIKILQKAQMSLEKLYTELDGIRVPLQLKKLKHDLTSKSVTVADKVDDLISVLEGHKNELLEKENESETEGEKEEVKEQQPKPRKIRRIIIEAVDDSDF